MKSSIISFSFFLITAIQQTRSGKENEINANADTNKVSDTMGASPLKKGKQENMDWIKKQVDPATRINTGTAIRSFLPPWEVANAYAYVESLKATAFGIREQARWEFDAAMHVALLDEDRIKEEAHALLQDIKREQNKDKLRADQNYKKELKEAEKLKNLANADKGKQKEYEDAVKQAVDKRRKIFDNIKKKYEKKRPPVNAILIKAQANFNDALDRASRRYEAAMKEADGIDFYISRVLYSIHG